MNSGGPVHIGPDAGPYSLNVTVPPATGSTKPVTVA